MSRLTYQIPNFTYPDHGPADIFGTVVAQATEADQSGFDRICVMDHFYQLPLIGVHDEPMFEAYTLLAALAQHTSKARLATLVTGNTYRSPTLLAKTITALDHVSGGRATLGIGAGWFELEHESLGFEFGTFTDRFEKLEEALRILVPLLKGETVTVEGERYTTKDAVNSPAPLSSIPIMIGGSGEKKTLRMVAQYADESNLVGLRTPAEIVPKLEALDGHCERLGRDRSSVVVTTLLSVNIAPTMEQADADLLAMVEAKGWPDEMFEMAKGMMIHGDPDTVGEGIQAFLDAGLDGVACNLMANGHVPGRVTLLGETASALLG